MTILGFNQGFLKGEDGSDSRGLDFIYSAWVIISLLPHIMASVASIVTVAADNVV